MFLLTRFKPDGYRSIICQTLDCARQTAAVIINAKHGEWENRTPLLWGNQGKLPEEYEVYLWRNLDATLDELRIEPVAVHDNPRAAACLLR